MSKPGDIAISIENDKSWYDRILDQIERQGLNNVEYHFRLITQNESLASAPYPVPLFAAGDIMFDFLKVDGEYRDDTILFVLGKAKTSGICV